MDPVSRRTFLEGSLAALAASAVPASADTEAFVAAPYVQLGDAPVVGSHTSLAVLWLAADAEAQWAVEYRSANGDWRKATRPRYRLVAASGVQRHRVYRTTLSGLAPGETVEYRVAKGGAVVFETKALARKPTAAPSRFVIFGDCGDGSASQRRIAYHTYQQKPDYVVIPGDIVYGSGLISQYLTRYFPVYNSDHASPETGGPLSRSTIFVGNLGNHDTYGRDFYNTPDGLAYYLYFDQPLNGPSLVADEASATPIEAPEAEREAFLEGSGPAYARMANFSFDYANVHWTVLDANEYVSWDDRYLRDWLIADLKHAQDATWRFVAFHHPGFSSSKAHYSEQHMRRLSPIFERYGVDVVWAGHVHNYQRSKPLHFQPARNPKPTGPLDGKFTFDEAYDGEKVTKANGIIYIVTGGGGATLYNGEQENNPKTWQPFTSVFISKLHSLTVADIDDKRLTVRQIDETGAERDRWVLTK